MKDIMPDKAAVPCGFWYINLIIPSELGIADPNLCFIFKK
jgi:hypothetical protein